MCQVGFLIFCSYKWFLINDLLFTLWSVKQYMACGCICKCCIYERVCFLGLLQWTSNRFIARVHLFFVVFWSFSHGNWIFFLFSIAHLTKFNFCSGENGVLIIFLVGFPYDIRLHLHRCGNSFQALHIDSATCIWISMPSLGDLLQ